MTDLNTAIAVSKGWKCHTTNDEFGINETWFTPRNTPSIHNHIPDYEHDANLYMALFEEMGQETDTHEPYDLHIDFIDRSYQCSVVEHGYDYAKDRDNYCPIVVRIADTIGTAICLAYCKLKGIEVVG